MRNNYYLFCNKGYGHDFFHQFIRFAKKNPDNSYHVIISIKGVQKGIFSSVKRKFKEFLKSPRDWWRCKAFFSKVKFSEILNVNDSQFIKKIPLNSYCFVAGFNQIFCTNFINQFEIIVNFHPSILPFYRGAIPSYWVVKNQEKSSGFTVHVVTDKVDDGEIIYQELISVSPGDTESDLDKKISNVASKYFFECLLNINSHNPFRQQRVNSPYKTPMNLVPAKRL